MRVLIVGILVLALAVAGVSTYLIQTFSGEENIEELQKEAKKPEISILVAAKDLGPGDRLGPDTVTWQAWAEEALNDNYIAVEREEEQERRMKDFAGSIVRHTVAKGEPIVGGMVFKRDAPGFLAGALEKGMRAVSVKVTPITGAAGFILPGDRVDVLLTHDKARDVVKKKLRNANDPDAPLKVITHTTETILRDLRVLAVDTVVGKPKEGQTVAAKTVTLEVSPKQAESLVTAGAMGKLSLSLRSLAGGPGSDDSGTFTTDVDVSPLISNIDEVLAGRGVSRARDMQERIKELESQLSNRPSAPAPTKKKESVIKIYRGGKSKVEEIKVQ